jgi:hypothetical protein
MGKKKKIVASVQDPDLEWKIVVEYKLWKVNILLYSILNKRLQCLKFNNFPLHGHWPTLPRSVILTKFKVICSCRTKLIIYNEAASAITSKDTVNQRSSSKDVSSESGVGVRQIFYLVWHVCTKHVAYIFT